MAARRLRVFLDTSALMAGLISSSGAAREVLRLAEAEVIEVIVSQQVIVEADRNFGKKFPDLLAGFRLFMRSLNPVVVSGPSQAAVKEAARVIHADDAPILAAAIQERVDFLVTWNTRHFMKTAVTDATPFPIVTPAEFLEEFRKLLED